MEQSVAGTLSVGNAIDDLVYGYDKLMTTLPVLAGKVSEMHSGTENLARNLEDKIRSLISGYEYLDSVAVQMPEAFANSASMHRKALLEAGHVLGAGDSQSKENFDLQVRQLDSLKAELKSLSQERIVVDVLSRQTISRAKDLCVRAPATRSTTSNLRGLSRMASKREPPSSDLLRSVPSYSVGATPHSLPPTPNPARTHNLDDPISLPQYTAPLSATIEVASKTSLRDSNSKQAVGLSPRLVARAVGEGNMMVPSMRQGRLPVELRDLKTSPTDINLPAPLLAPRRRRRKSPKQGASDIKRIAMATASQAIALKYSETEAQLQQVRGEMETAVDRYERERSQSRRQMKSLAASIQEKISEQYEEKDVALQGRIGKLVEDAVGRLERVTQDRCKVMSQLVEQTREMEEVTLRREEQDRRRRAAEAKRQGDLIKSLVKISSAPVVSSGGAPAYRVVAVSSSGGGGGSAVSSGAAAAAPLKQSAVRTPAVVKASGSTEGRSSSGTQTAAVQENDSAATATASIETPVSVPVPAIAPASMPASTIGVVPAMSSKSAAVRHTAQSVAPRVVAAKPTRVSRASKPAPLRQKKAMDEALQINAVVAAKVTAIPSAPAPKAVTRSSMPNNTSSSSLRSDDPMGLADSSQWGLEQSMQQRAEQRARERRREGAFQLVGDHAGLRWVLRSSYDQSDPIFSQPLHSGLGSYRSGGEGVGGRSVAELTGEDSWYAASSDYAEGSVAQQAGGLITIRGDALRASSGAEQSASLDVDGCGVDYIAGGSSSVVIEQGLLLQFQDGSVAPVPASAIPTSRAEVPLPPSYTVDYEHRTTHVPPIMSRIARTETSNPSAPPIFPTAEERGSAAAEEEVVQQRKGGDTIEKDLLQLLQTVVASQQETLRGNQALMSALLQQSEQPAAAAPEASSDAPRPVQPSPVAPAAAAVAASTSWDAAGALETVSSKPSPHPNPNAPTPRQAELGSSVSSSSGWVASRADPVPKEVLPVQPTAADIALQLALALREAAVAAPTAAPAQAVVTSSTSDGLSSDEVSAAVVRGVQEGVRQAMDALATETPHAAPGPRQGALLRLRVGPALEDFDALMARDIARSEQSRMELLLGADDDAVDFICDNNAFIDSERVAVCASDEMELRGTERPGHRSRPVAIARPLVSRMVPSSAAARLAKSTTLAELLEEEEDEEEDVGVRSSAGSDDWSLVIQAEEDH